MDKRRVVLCLVFVALAVAWAAPAAAGPFDPIKKEGMFWVAMGGNADTWADEWASFLVPGGSGGDGYMAQAGGPRWFAYPNPDFVPGTPGPTGGPVPQQQQPPMNWIPGWHNQWWYDHPYSPDRWKDLWLSFDYMLLDPTQPGLLDMVVNWTRPEWPDPNNPPLPGQMDPVIGRDLLQHIQIPVDPTGANPIGHYEGHFDLREWGIDYNPEWISVDVAGYNFLISQQQPGSIIHACVDVPEPLTVLGLLGGISGLGVYLRRRRAA